MLRKSRFFDFLMRDAQAGFEGYMAVSTEDQHYIEWNGFVLPNDYGNAEFEYMALRNSCAIFDVSPLRKIRIHGSGAGAFLDRLVTRPVSHLAEMRANYVVFCEDSGALKDDAILYKLADDEFLLMPSDIDHSPYFESLRRRFMIEGVAFTECTDAWAGLAIQGPRSATVLHRMGLVGVEHLKPFAVKDFEWAEGLIRISRVGFTADLGYECWFNPEMADEIIRGIQRARVSLGIEIPGYGLDALQACRLEGGFIVAGWDCSTELDPQPGFERSPFELGLGWLVDLDAVDFIGRDALLEQREIGQRFTLRCFTTSQAVHIDDGQVLHAGADVNSTPIGSVNSSCWSWGLQKTIGNASLQMACSDAHEAWLFSQGQAVKLELARGPLIDLKHRSVVPALIDC
jgi:aminomethyltransferase